MMKASFFESARYVAPQAIPQEWPVPAGYFEPAAGSQSLRDALHRIQMVEDMGFDWVSFSEHHYAPRIMTPSISIMASYVAARQSRIKIALLGPIVPLSNPVRVAEELAMLDNLTQGRLVVGLLRGTSNEFQTFGVKPEETRDKTTEGMDLILKAWTEPQPFGWAGRHYQYRTVAVWPRPLQQPYPPTYSLGTSKESCDFAAENHLGLGVSFAPMDVVCKATRYYRDQCALYGWEPTGDQVIYRANILLADSDGEATEALALSHASAQAPFGLRPNLQGYLAKVAPRNLAGERRDQGLGALPTTFIGGPNTVVEQVRRCREEVGAGVIDFSFQNPWPDDRQGVERALELFGEKVLPRIQDI